MCQNVCLSILFILFLALSSCKKEDAEEHRTGILEEGPMSPKLGKRIRLDDYPKFGGNWWGRDYNELFISTGTKLLRLDFSALKAEVLESSGGLFTGKTNENSGVIFIGTINGSSGYHEYTFATNKIGRLLSLTKEQVTSLHIAGNTMVFYTGISGPPSDPCNDIWDLWCSNTPTVHSNSLYHVDKETKQFTRLPYKAFLQFSKDGSKSVFTDNWTGFTYIFDNSAKRFTDSFALLFSDRFYLKTLYQEEFKSYYFDADQNQLVAVNPRTNQELERFSLNMASVGLMRMSADGTKILYAGVPVADANTRVLALYDMTTREEKIIATLSAGESSLIDGGETILSDDNKRLLIRYLNDLYLKDIN